jgi:hypothetical protein
VITIILTAAMVFLGCAIFLAAAKDLSTEQGLPKKEFNHLEVLGFDKLAAYLPQPAAEFAPIVPAFPPFDLDAAFQTSLDEAAAHKEKLRQSVINGSIFKTAIDYIASVLDRQLGIDVFLGKIDVDLWGAKPDTLYQWQIFLEEFSKMCQSKGIKTKMSENGSFLILELQSLLHYRDSLLGKQEPSIQQAAI